MTDGINFEANKNVWQRIIVNDQVNEEIILHCALIDSGFSPNIPDIFLTKLV